MTQVMDEKPIGLTSSRKKSMANLLKGNERGQGYKKGESGNRGRGRPVGLVNMVKEGTDDGKVIVAKMLDIVHERIESTTRDKIAALEWLADRGFGKAPVLLEHTGKDGGAIQMENATLGQLEAAARDLGMSIPQMIPISSLTKQK